MEADMSAKKSKDMRAQREDLLYQERLISTGTQGFFLALTLVFFIPFMLRVQAVVCDWLTFALGFFAVTFLFYTVNYRMLLIQVTAQELVLKFGLFTWRESRQNIKDCALDSMAAWQYYGGAGIHYLLVRGRYRVSFNFLQYPRVMVSLKKKKGLVKDISFSSEHPQELLKVLSERGNV
jgi:hypothetical protein